MKNKRYLLRSLYLMLSVFSGIGAMGAAAAEQGDAVFTHGHEDEALILAAKEGRIDEVKALLDQDVTEWGAEQALWNADEKGYEDIVNILLLSGKVNKVDFWLRVAVKKGKVVEVMSYLNDDNISTQGVGDALAVAAENGCKDEGIFRVLLNHSKITQEWIDFAFTLAAANQHGKAIKIFFEKGVSQHAVEQARIYSCLLLWE